MRKKSKQRDSFLVIAIGTILIFIFTMIIKLVALLYNLTLYIKTDYKKKTNVNFFKMYFNKGLYGEFTFYKKLIKIINKENVFLNIYLDNVNTEYTEVDMIAVTSKGIYVFEIKNYGGWIFGNYKDRYWMQVFNKNTKNKFLNPLRQNYAHMNALEKFLNVEEDKLTSIIAFSNRSKLKDLTINNSSNVFHFKEALKFIKENEKLNNNNILNVKEVEDISSSIKSRTLVDDNTKIVHIESVRNKYN